MAEYKSAKLDAITLQAETLETFAYQVFFALGMSDEYARIVAKQLIWAEMRGYPWLGAKKILQYGKRIKTGATNPYAIPQIIKEGPAFAHFDGQNSFGQVAGETAMRTAIQKAETAGTCVSVIRDSGTAFCLGYFAEMAASRNMIGMAINNAPPLMPVYGGAEKLIGNQAFAVGAPTGKDFTLIFDTALSEATLVRLHKYEKMGEQMPLGLGLDAEGRPTTDPTAALAGMLVPLAGHRGSGLAVMWEVLTGVLSGGERFMSDVTMPDVFDRPQATSLFFLAINPECFMPFDDFTTRVDDLIDRIHATKRAEGFDRIYAPGEQGAARVRRAMAEGVHVDGELVEQLHAFARELGVKARLA